MNKCFRNFNSTTPVYVTWVLLRVLFIETLTSLTLKQGQRSNPQHTVSTSRDREIEIPKVRIPIIKTRTITIPTATKGKLYNSRLQRDQLLTETMGDSNAPIIASHDDTCMNVNA